METGNKVDLKALAKLAKACRKAGVKSFKGYGMEFTLDDTIIPQVRHRSTAAKTVETSPANDKFDSDMPNQDEILFWSTGLAESTGET